MEWKLGNGVSSVVNVYGYQTRGPIQAAYIDAGLQQYGNTDTVGSKGIEFELSGKAWGASRPRPDTAG
jgi:outer membrane receptor protein involved in Fe transport